MLKTNSKKANTTRTAGILQVLPGLTSGGVEREVLDIAEAIVKAGYRSFVASSGGRLVNQLYQQGSRHIVLRLDSKNPFIILQNIFKLRKLVKLYDIDIIHAQSRAPAWSAYYAAKLANCHFVTTVHGAYGVQNWFKRWYNSVMTKGEKVIAVSNFIADYVRGNYQIDEKKLQVIHCGANIDKFSYKNIEEQRVIALIHKLHIPTYKPIIILAARFSRNKGHAILLEAIRLLPLKSVTCLFVGDYGGHLKYREELQAKIDEYGLTKSVIFTGNISDMAAAYALADIVVSASTKPEAFGLTSIEAQAMGRMVIANNIGGIRETIIHGKTGWLIDPGNIVELAETIKKILSMNLDDRFSHAEAAANHVKKNFSLTRMGKDIIDCYNSILN